MSESVPEKLQEYRVQIDALDAELIDALAQRFEIVSEVGVLKSHEGMTAIQPERAQAVIDKAVEMGVAKGLDADFVRRLYEMMIDHAHVLEDEILEKSA